MNTSEARRDLTLYSSMAYLVYYSNEFPRFPNTLGGKQTRNLYFAPVVTETGTHQHAAHVIGFVILIYHAPNPCVKTGGLQMRHHVSNWVLELGDLSRRHCSYASLYSSLLCSALSLSLIHI